MVTMEAVASPPERISTMKKLLSLVCLAGILCLVGCGGGIRNTASSTQGKETTEKSTTTNKNP
jgi:hypothetical protein